MTRPNFASGPEHGQQDDGRMEGRTMTRGVPVLDPAVHLKGATPEKLAKALFRRTEPLPPRVGKPVAGDEVAVEKVSTDEPGNSVPHLGKSA
jgi:hypothetical protein